MLANTWISHSHRLMFGNSRRLKRGSIVALAALSMVTVLGISELTARSGIELPGETVNRILKGDRSPLAFRIQTNVAPRRRQINTPLGTASNSRLPVGCESLVSAFAHSQLARVAGRCVS